MALKAWREGKFSHWIVGCHWTKGRDDEQLTSLISFIINKGEIASFVKETEFHESWSKNECLCKAQLQDEVFKRFSDYNWVVYFNELKRIKLEKGENHRIAPLIKNASGSKKFLDKLPPDVKKKLKIIS